MKRAQVKDMKVGRTVVRQGYNLTHFPVWIKGRVIKVEEDCVLIDETSSRSFMSLSSVPKQDRFVAEYFICGR